MHNINKIYYKYILMAILVVAAMASFGRLIWGETVFSCDVLAYQLPEKILIRNAILSGQFPFLNPFILSGSIFYANIDSGVINPLNIILLIGNKLYGYNLYVFAHFLLSMIFMYILLKRAYKINFWIALLGSVSYAGGYLWSMSGNGFYRCGYLVPILIFSLERHAECFGDLGFKRRCKWMIVSVIALAALLCCGNFLEAYFSVIFGGMSVLFKIYQGFMRKEAKKAIKMFVDNVLVLMTALLLAAPVLCPVISASLTSYRNNGIPIVEAQQWSFPPVRILEYILPYIFGARQGDGFWYGGIYQVEETFSKTGMSPWADFIYVGIPILLGFIVFLCSRKDLGKKFILCSLFLSALLALGKFTPVYGAFYHLLPGFNMFRHPEKFMFWVNFWLIIAGCMGLQSILSERDRTIKLMWKLSGILAAVFLFMGIVLFGLFIFCQGPLVGYIQGHGSMLDGDKIFLWEEFTICLSLSVAVLILICLKLFRDKPHVLLFSLFFVTALNFVIWHNAIKWTIPIRELDRIGTWDERLPKFDRGNWRIFNTGKFIYPVHAGESIGDPFIVRKLMEYATLDCNTPVIKGLRTVSGFTPVMDERYVGYMNFERHEAERVLDLLSVRYIAIHEVPEASLPPGTRIIGRDEANEFVFLENTDALPRVGTCSTVIRALRGNSEKETFNPARNIHLNFVLEEVPADYDGKIACSSNSQAHIIEESYSKIRIGVENGPCWVVVRDWFNPGWTCRAGDKEVKIVSADGGLMAVFCPFKDRVLEFNYWPPGLTLGLKLLAAGFIMLILLPVAYPRILKIIG